VSGILLPEYERPGDAVLSEKVYTLPEIVQPGEKYLMTGNEKVALPAIRERDGGIEGVNCTSLQAKGLIEFRGGDKPFLKPVFQVNGANWSGELVWQKEFQWIPRFSGSFNRGSWGGTILAPREEGGWYYRLWVNNQGTDPIQVKLGWDLTWALTQQLIYHDHLLGCSNGAVYYPWTGTLVLEARGQVGLAALAVVIHDPRLNQVELNDVEKTPWAATNGRGSYQAFIGGGHQVMPGQTLELDLIVGLNVEADGAAVTGVHLCRLGFTQCYNKTISWLEKQAERTLTGIQLAKKQAARQLQEGEKQGDRYGERPGEKKSGNALARLEKLVLRNLFFNYYFSNSITIDTNEPVMLTSRSGRYYVSGAFWARDAFLWSFPAILLSGKDKALELLETGFTRYAKNGPFHSCYIDGALLYPGFELDELAAFLVAINSYDQMYGDFPWQEDWVLAGARVLEQVLWQHHHPGLYLFATFLDPSDDQVEYPYLTYDNALAWQGILVLQKIYKAHNNNTHVRHLDGAGRLLKKAINQHCVVPGPFGPMYAWAVDGEGNYQLYDNPPGSLQLLPHYQFCSFKDKVWLNTLSWIYSSHNHYAYLDTAVKGFGGVHAPAPWVLGACNSLLAGKLKEGLTLLKNSDMDNGYACETVDPETGSLHTGAAFAPCAGFLAYSLIKVIKEHGWKAVAGYFN